MNAVQCPGCKQPFNPGKALKAHQKHCTTLHVVAKERFRQREENAQKRAPLKLARLEGQTMQNIAEEREKQWDDHEGDIVLDQSVEAGSSILVRIRLND